MSEASLDALKTAARRRFAARLQREAWTDAKVFLAEAGAKEIKSEDVVNTETLAAYIVTYAYNGGTYRVTFERNGRFAPFRVRAILRTK